MTRSGRWIESPAKRAIDLCGSALALGVLWPVIAALALVLRRRCGPPVLFRQTRAGRNGEPIGVTKFRTMSDDRDDQGVLLADEERLTPFGRRLRSTSLDELPQLWSVLRGDLSLVGPRPLPLAYVERYSGAQRRRLEAKPGITGWAQVNGRNSLDWTERFALDVWYVDNASLWLDIRILVRTVAAVVKPSGVSAPGHATMHEFMG